jgi:hypothetical protein
MGGTQCPLLVISTSAGRLCLDWNCMQITVLENLICTSVLSSNIDHLICFPGYDDLKECDPFSPNNINTLQALPCSKSYPGHRIFRHCECVCCTGEAEHLEGT